LEIASILLEAGASVNATSKSKGETALHIAIRDSRQDIIDLLLVHHVDLEVKTTDKGETALHYAAAKSDSLALVMKLLKFGAKHEAQNTEGQTPAAVALQAHNIHAAVAIINMARGKRTQLAKEKDMLLKHVEKTRGRSSMTNDLIADIFTTTCDPDSTVLIEAIRKNDAGLVEMFLEKGADPHRADTKGSLPIYIAVKCADVRIVKLLVQHGADATTRDSGNNNLLQILINTSEIRDSSCVLAIADYLFAKGADARTLYQDGKTLLHRAVDSNLDHAGLVQLLLKKGIDFNAQDNVGNTALHLAAANGLRKATSILLHAGADTTTLNLKKQVPLLCAVQHQHWSVVSLLVIPPAITSWDAEGSTALHHIARSVSKSSAEWNEVAAATKLFCDRGSCRSMRDRSGATPLIQAVKTLPEEGLPVVKTLLSEGDQEKNCVGHEDHKRRDALYYAAILGKLAFVEVLLKHGAPFVVEEWADGIRQFRLPSTTKTRTLELIAVSHCLREESASKEQSVPVRDARVGAITSKQRTSSALSGYHADCESNKKGCKSRPEQRNITRITRKTSMTQHLQTPSRQKLGPSTPTMQAGSLSERSKELQVVGAAAFRAEPTLRMRTNQSSSLTSSIPKQATITSTATISHGGQSTKNLRARSTSKEASKSLSVLPLRVSSKHQARLVTPSLLSKESYETNIIKPLAPKTTKLVSAVEAGPRFDSSTAVDVSVPTVRIFSSNVKPQMEETRNTPVDLSKSNTITDKVLAMPSGATARFLPPSGHLPEAATSTASKPAEKQQDTTALPVTALEPVQPVRVDSGVGLTKNNHTAKVLPELNRYQPTIDAGETESKRQSGDELASWLAISGMLHRL
jgi:ankyrin repeat protein